MPLWRRPDLTKGYRGSWSDRLDELFACNVDYAGKTVLDVGCNAGVIAYEIAKQRPKHIHGVDIEPKRIFVAQTIFLGVPIESRFETLDLGNPRKLAATIVEGYDVILFLALYHILWAKLGAERTRGIVRHLASHCREAFVVRIQPQWEDEFAAILRDEGLKLDFAGVSSPQLNTRIITFKRVAART